PHLRVTLFPYTTLFRSSRQGGPLWRETRGMNAGPGGINAGLASSCNCTTVCMASGRKGLSLVWMRKTTFGSEPVQVLDHIQPQADRKSTRLNSSHLVIS